MYVNTSVVKALLYLRGISVPEMANLTHTPVDDLNAWLDDRLDEDSDRMPFTVQTEVLRLLGIDGESPRQDVVHYWRTTEPFFGNIDQTYWALSIMLKAFGKAQAVYISREADPLISLKSLTHFGLKFQGFTAILEINAHPFRSLQFDPTRIPDLSWVPETFGVLLPEHEYLRLEPGSMKVRGMNQYLTYSAEVSRWEKLREAAIEHGLQAEQVAQILLGETNTPLLASAEPRDVGPMQPEAPPAEPVLKPSHPPTHNPSIQELHVKSARNAHDDMELFVTPVTAAAATPIAVARPKFRRAKG